MNIAKRKEKLISKLKNKEYRDAFVAELINTGIPFQIRALREQRKWTQGELGNHTGMAQESISRLEDPNYAKPSLTTLKKLASAFDIGLLVRFVPFSELVEWELNLTANSLKALSFKEEPYFKENLRVENIPPKETIQLEEYRKMEKPLNVLNLSDYRERPPETHLPRLRIGLQAWN